MPLHVQRRKWSDKYDLSVYVHLYIDLEVYWFYNYKEKLHISAQFSENNGYFGICFEG